ncbi:MULTISPECIES: pyrroloquinoline quinone biosynthesis peptide chaperone PqqD [Xanthobacter]|uniref:pyrroloquinoline quinone biosynthesis peptide chaperone PqqD n=1 Tax=Xanthobacter TaxID=279 RepID=UPI0024A6B6C0|nr:pyrroloquinoline quinone biosynthesis peptide chaperone PqqD [Xanthobacter autotrophicus]MDI4657385.1 pyrroloquinoline quinone biosynthesis peptide chaperone PqqD [Xanthobacter autotrophicus]MDI4665517.1 pyrroloquinoline quinone biosynthesis peptide chaperone PqqD [Xanthobacter autotrophicus]
MTAVTAASVPRLPRGVRLERDSARGIWLLLAPERIFELDQMAVAVIDEVDGISSIAAITRRLAQKYAASQARVEAEIIAMIERLVAQRVVDLQESA